MTLGTGITATLILPPGALAVVEPSPELLSQLNVERALGLPARAYLELLRSPGCTVHVIRVGKLRLVERTAFVAWLKQRAPLAIDAQHDDEDDETLAELGLASIPTTKTRK